jgi:hypothetical protein
MATGSEENKPALDAFAEEYNKAELDGLTCAISSAVANANIDDVLALLTGAFVGLTLELVRRAGHDINKEILVDGGMSRDITIHAPKG